MYRRHKKITPGDVLVLCVFVSICLAASYQELNAQTRQQPERHSYKIDLKIDFDRLTYTGTERVRWINRSEKPTSIIYFHLYPNLRTGDQPLATNGTTPDADEPRIDILEVRAGSDDSASGVVDDRSRSKSPTL